MLIELNRIYYPFYFVVSNSTFAKNLLSSKKNRISGENYRQYNFMMKKTRFKFRAIPTLLVLLFQKRFILEKISSRLHNAHLVTLAPQDFVYNRYHWILSANISLYILAFYDHFAQTNSAKRK